MLSLSFGSPLCAVGQIYVLILIARAISSWFPLSPNSGFIPVVRFLHAVTEPVLAPFRRIIPPMGMFDLSFLLAILVIQIIVQILCAQGI